MIQTTAVYVQCPFKQIWQIVWYFKLWMNCGIGNKSSSHPISASYLKCHCTNPLISLACSSNAIHLRLLTVFVQGHRRLYALMLILLHYSPDRTQTTLTSQPSSYSALTAYFLIGKCVCFFFCFCVTRLASFFDSRLLIARVCFGRRSSGKYFLFL
jgi:hypothetical protein